MALKITKSSDPIEVTAAKVMIYGQPGVGKTSLAFSAGNVLMLDTDNGAYRSAFRGDTVQVQSWDDIRSVTPEDLTDYEAVAIDTIGKQLEWMTAAMIEQNPKMGNGSGGPSMQGWGKLKTDFATWVKTLTLSGKHIIMVAHDKEDKSGDTLIVRPDIQGSSVHEVFKIADAIGYMYADEKGRVLDFNPSSKWLGKNVAQLDPLRVPNLNQEPLFLQGVIRDVLMAVNSMSAEGKRIAVAVAAYKADIDEVTTVNDLNQWLKDLTEMEDKAIQGQVRSLLWNRSQALEIPFSQEKKCFVDTLPEAANG